MTEEQLEAWERRLNRAADALGPLGNTETRAHAVSALANAAAAVSVAQSVQRIAAALSD